MSIDNTQVVDAIGTEKGGTLVTLTITDHLGWGDDEHLLLLQKKLNTYLAFIESGEIHEAYPAAKDKPLRINVVCKYVPDERGRQFLSKAKDVIEGAGFALTYEVPLGIE
jgi:hypothetical protein